MKEQPDGLTVHLGVRVEPGSLEKIDRMAEQMSMSRSLIIRLILKKASKMTFRELTS